MAYSNPQSQVKDVNNYKKYLWYVEFNLSVCIKLDYVRMVAQLSNIKVLEMLSNSSGFNR
jgi:hypothetical protein